MAEVEIQSQNTVNLINNRKAKQETLDMFKELLAQQKEEFLTELAKRDEQIAELQKVIE